MPGGHLLLVQLPLRFCPADYQPQHAAHTADVLAVIRSAFQAGWVAQASKAASSGEPQRAASEEEAAPAAPDPPVKQEAKLSKADKRRLAREQQQARSDRAHRSEQRAALLRCGPDSCVGCACCESQRTHTAGWVLTLAASLLRGGSLP